MLKENVNIAKRDKQIITQLMILTGSNSRISAALQRMDQKLQKIMTAHNRVRAMALPSPDIPSPFLDFLPVKSDDDLMSVEALIMSGSEENAIQYKEDLVSYKVTMVLYLNLTKVIFSFFFYYLNSKDLCTFMSYKNLK